MNEMKTMDLKGRSLIKDTDFTQVLFNELIDSAIKLKKIKR
ncbi:hypothetical protein SAGN_04280 [Staphylococcus agnetis]|nr:hypothetical protein SAGN_04280 [Staphylococcus agnetis]